MTNQRGLFTALLPEMEKEIEEHTLLTQFIKKYAEEKQKITKINHNVFKQIVYNTPLNLDTPKIEVNIQNSNSNQSFQNQQSPNICNIKKKSLSQKKVNIELNSNSMLLLNSIMKRNNKPNTPLNNKQVFHSQHYYNASSLSPNQSRYKTGFYSANTNFHYAMCENNNNHNLKGSTHNITSAIIPKYTIKSLQCPFKKEILLNHISNKNELFLSDRNSMSESPLNKSSNNTRDIEVNVKTKRKLLFAKMKINFWHNHKQRKRNEFNLNDIRSISGSSLAQIKKVNDELTNMINDDHSSHNKNTTIQEERRKMIEKLLLDEESKIKKTFNQEFKQDYKLHLNSGDNYVKLIRCKAMKHRLEFISKITPDVVYKQRNYLDNKLGFEIDKDIFQSKKRAKSTIKRHNNISFKEKQKILYQGNYCILH